MRHLFHFEFHITCSVVRMLICGILEDVFEPMLYSSLNEQHDIVNSVNNLSSFTYGTLFFDNSTLTFAFGASGSESIARTYSVWNC